MMRRYVGTIERPVSELRAARRARLRNTLLRGRGGFGRRAPVRPVPVGPAGRDVGLGGSAGIPDGGGRSRAPYRRGAKALFSGPTGTGKTLTARAIAASLGRPLFRVDLAGVVSKWVGETEKNLRRALEAAETLGAVLLFDEGDALFGKRGEVDRGSDRYANVEVSFLLQALEELDGVVIVTTNLRGNVDGAFQRRFDAMVEFARPDAAVREALWRQELGEATKAIPEAFLRRVAKDCDLSGGYIAVACRVARALAMADGRTDPTATHVAAAIAGELRKLGGNVAASRWEAEVEAACVSEEPRTSGRAR